MAIEMDIPGSSFADRFSLRKSSVLLDPNTEGEIGLGGRLRGNFRLLMSVGIDLERHIGDLHYRLSQADGVFQKVAEIYKFSADLSQIEKASRTTNSLNTNQIPQFASSQGLIREAVEHPDMGHHGWIHFRGIEKELKYLLRKKAPAFNHHPDAFLLKEERKHAPRVEQIKSATPHVLMRFAGTHDLHQLLGSFWNRNHTKELRVKPKDGHEWLGGLMVLLDQDRYAQVSGASGERARLITNMLAVAIPGHGEPTTYFRDILAREKAYRIIDNKPVEIPNEELFALLDAKTLDISSVSPSQYYKICAYLRERENWSTFPTETGLDPIIEADYKKSGDMARVQSDHQPFFIDLTDEERRIFLWIRHNVGVVDMTEKLLPVIKAFFRKIDTDKAYERYTFVAQNPLDEGFSAREYVEQLQRIDGHACKSDYERMWFEALQFIHDVEAAGFFEDTDLGPIFREFIIDAISGQYWAFDQLLSGDTDGISNFVNTVYQAEAFDAGMKTVRKSQLPQKERILSFFDSVSNVIIPSITIDEIQTVLSQLMREEPGQKYFQRMNQRLVHINQARRTTLAHIWHKLELRPTESQDREQAYDIFRGIAEEAASLMKIDVERIYERLAVWQKRSLVQNIQESRMPWSSSNTYVGSPQDAKRLI